VTDGRTDGQNSYINIARQYADARYKLLPMYFSAIDRKTPKNLVKTDTE